MLVDVLPSDKSKDVRGKVQFGAAGPFATYKLKNLSIATYDDVKEAGLLGVGGLVIMPRSRTKDRSE
jgi:hypothetical protein